MATGPLIIDLQAAQSPAYRERGVARYATDFTKAILARYPGAVDRVLVNPDLPPLSGLDGLVVSGKVSGRRRWEGTGGVFHVLSPFELDVPLTSLWPRLASTREMRLVVTVYDLIPQLYPEIYLVDPGQRRRYRARLELVRAADHIVTLSKSAADDVVAQLGIAEDKVTVVGAACAAAFRPPVSRQAAVVEARTKVAGLTKRFVVYNGAVEPRKNMERLVEAFAALPSGVLADWQLVLVCRLKPLERNHFEVRARQLGIEDNIVLTGFVPDEVLVTLYQAADLVAVPSLYEGYGLPVAEALACGAPVIAANTSSLRELVTQEARFDPLDTGAITAALQRACTDEAFRARLEQHATKPQPKWADVADRAMEVYDQLRPSSGHLRRHGMHRRPALALVTPLPPSATGVAVYSSQLIAALSDQADVDVFVDGDEPDLVSPVDRSLIAAPSKLVRFDQLRGGYDAVVYCLGNSEFHSGALRLLKQRRQGIVLAHDVRLSGLYRHASARGAVPEGFAAALRGMYPELPTDVGAQGWLAPDMAGWSALLMAREIIGLSDMFLVTSEYAAELARSDARPEDQDRVAVLPYAYPPVADPADRLSEPGLVCSFGIVNEAKRPQLLVEAFTAFARRRPDARLAFVGPTGVLERERIIGLAERLGVSDRVVVTGWLDEHGYQDWLSRAAVAVQLRAFSNGETSGAVADCLIHGVPTIVTNIGPAGDLPHDSVVKVAVDADAQQLAVQIETLLDDLPLRRRLSEGGRLHAAHDNFDLSASTLLDLVLPLRGLHADRKRAG
jgi:glycosyltransferase involved in cell wall biosynthesis